MVRLIDADLKCSIRMVYFQIDQSSQPKNDVTDAKPHHTPSVKMSVKQFCISLNRGNEQMISL